MRKWTYGLLGLAAVLLVILAVALLMNNGSISYDEAASAEFSATVEDTAGVDIHSSFVVRFDGRVSAGSMRNALTVEPVIELNYHQGNSKEEVLLVPNQLLEEGTVYTFTLATDGGKVQWAVQTAAPPRITGISPEHGSEYVPIDAEICFTLSQDLPLDLSNIDEYFSIDPQVAGSFRQEGHRLYFSVAEAMQHDTIYTVSLQPGLKLQGSNYKLEEGFTASFATVQSSLWQLSDEQTLFTTAEPLQFGFTGGSDEVAVRLYAFADAAAFAAEAERLAAVPQQWQQHPHFATDIAALTPVFADDYAAVSVEQLAGREYLLQLPALPQGFYLMCCEYGGELRQQLFQVADLQAVALERGAEALVWVHDALTELPTAATVTAAEATVQTDATGVAVLPAAASYIISTDTAQLVLTQAELNIPAAAANQRCLYLNDNIYAYNDTLRFWGMVRPADGSQLQWPRVSVYIFRADAAENADDALHHSYAALNDFVFGGEVALPNLLPGAYQLQIWQSGVCLAAAPFDVGYAEAEPPADIVLSYADGVFIAETERLGQTLFWRAAADGISAVTQPDAATAALYGEVNLRDGEYLFSDAMALYDAPVAEQLTVAMRYADGELQVVVADHNALPVAGTAVLLRALNISNANDDTASAAAIAADTAVYNDFSCCFISGVTDENGIITFDDIALLPGEWELAVTAIKTVPQLRIGEAVIIVSGGTAAAEATDGWQPLFCQPKGGLTADAHTKAVLITGQSRSDAVSELWQYTGSSSWQATAAQLQLLRAYPQLQLDVYSNNGHLLQKNSGAVGGLAETDRISSVYAALLLSEVCDVDALADYLRATLQGDDVQRAQALCALAALGEEVLPELLFEAGRVADPRAQAWLLLGRWYAGDEQTALRLWQESAAAEYTLAAAMLDALSGKTPAETDNAAETLLLLGASLQANSNCGSFSYKLEGKNHRHAAGGEEELLLLNEESGFQLLSADAATSIIFWQPEQ